MDIVAQGTDINLGAIHTYLKALALELHVSKKRKRQPKRIPMHYSSYQRKTSRSPVWKGRERNEIKKKQENL